MIGTAAASSLAKEPGRAAKVIAAVVNRALHLRIEGEKLGEAAAKITQLVMDTAPIVIQGMVQSLPVELQGQTLAAYKDENDEIEVLVVGPHVLAVFCYLYYNVENRF